jgi:hypothetical protein
MPLFLVGKYHWLLQKQIQIPDSNILYISYTKMKTQQRFLIMTIIIPIKHGWDYQHEIIYINIYIWLNNAVTKAMLTTGLIKVGNKNQTKLEEGLAVFVHSCTTFDSV